MADFDSVLSLGADTRGLRHGEDALDDIADKGEQTEKRTKKSTDAMGRSYSRVGMSAQRMSATAGKALGALAVATATAFAAGNVISTISEFESAASRMGAISRATAADLAVMRDTAAQLGATTEFSATQAADGLGFLAMAGFQAREAVEALPPILDLATASSMGLAEAADITSNIMGAFQIPAHRAGRAADVMAAASSRANTSVSQLGQAMSTAAPVAAGMGISLEQTAAAIGVMSDAGIQASRAGTALRGSLAALASPTDQASDALRKYGISVGEVDPATRDLTDILGTLRDANISTADAMTIFGREAASGALVMIESANRVAELTAELRNAEGAASDMAEQMRDNLGGDIKTLQSSVSALILAMGDAGLTDVLRGTVAAATEVVRAFTVAAENADVFAAAVGVLAASKIPAAVGALGTLVTWLGTAEGLFIAGAVASRAMSVAMMAIPGVAIFTALTAAVTSVTRGLRQSAEAAREFARATAALAGEQELLNQKTTEFYDNMNRASVEAMRKQAERNRDMIKTALEAADAELEAAGWYARAFGVELFETERMAQAQAAIKQLGTALIEAEARLSAAEHASSNLEHSLKNTPQSVSVIVRQTDNWNVSMQDVLGTMNAIAGVLGSFTGSLFTSAAKQVQIDALRAGKSIAEARMQAEDFSAQQEAAAKRASAGGSLFKRIAAEAEIAADAVDLNRTRILASEMLLAQERESEKSGKGGAGSVLDLKTDLETLTDDLKTRREIISEWYDDGLKTLEDARERELITEAQHNEALERLSLEHQNRMMNVREMGAKSQVELAMGAGIEVLNAMGAFNKKALKIASIASAGMAFISTMQGAAKELEKGTFGFATAAMVIAKGMGFVAAIKGAASGGTGSAGAVGGGGSPATTQAPEPQQQMRTLQFNITNDPFGIGENIIRQLAAQFNEASRDGTNLIATVST